MIRCDRCHGETHGVTHTSWFNTQTICTECSEAEAEHPDYTYAKRVENEACSRGEFNFPGVGWPGPDGRVPGAEA